MRKGILILLIASWAFAGCRNNDYRKGSKGMEYKIINDGKGDLVKLGDYIEFNVTSKLARKNGKDSVFSSTAELGAPQIAELDSTKLPPDVLKIFLQLHKGDSLTTRTLSDTVFKESPQPMPAFIKKGDYLETNLRITNVYKTRQEADKAHQAAIANMQLIENKKAADQKNADDKTLVDYFAKHNIKATKTPAGAYIEMISSGAGPSIDTSNVVKLNYTGRTLAGVMFDSNTDSLKGHVGPLNVNLTNNPSLGQGVIAGLTDALKMMNKGEKANVYIPSGLGYGPRGAGGDIAPNTVLIFNIDVLDVLNSAQAAASLVAEQKKAEAMEKKAADSMAKFQKPAAGNAGAMPPQHP